MASRVLMLRRDDVCVVCGSALPAGAEAWWDATAPGGTGLSCKETSVQLPTAEPAPLQPEGGRAGASAARVHQRRKCQREARTGEAHPRIGGVLTGLRDTPGEGQGFYS